MNASTSAIIDILCNFSRRSDLNAQLKGLKYYFQQWLARSLLKVTAHYPFSCEA